MSSYDIAIIGVIPLFKWVPQQRKVRIPSPIIRIEREASKSGSSDKIGSSHRTKNDAVEGKDISLTSTRLLPR